MKPTLRRYLVSLAAGLALGALLFLDRGGLAAQGDSETYRLLCDAAFVPAAMLLCLGLIVFVADDGVFDMFGFAFMRATAVFRSPEMRAAMPKTYYDYHCLKHQKKADCRFLLAAGASLLALAFVFLLLYVTAP
ncbi:MAG: DUF3899 domain-containing protein [Clostridia bacterium]|nr:DUF3899 domain-containing protein [Clostridia bacterium]MBR4442998.1 DUF3899 domain-containing protein [Clostridia bacterium]